MIESAAQICNIRKTSAGLWLLKHRVWGLQGLCTSHKKHQHPFFSPLLLSPGIYTSPLSVSSRGPRGGAGDVPRWESGTRSDPHGASHPKRIQDALRKIKKFQPTSLIELKHYCFASIGRERGGFREKSTSFSMHLIGWEKENSTISPLAGRTFSTNIFSPTQQPTRESVVASARAGKSSHSS